MIRHAHCTFPALLLAIAATLGTARAASAQTVLARALDADSGQPISGALAYLVGADGATVRNALTDQIGRAMFVDVAAGEYRVRVEMIGRTTTTSAGFTAAPDAPARVDVRLPSSAIALEGIEVSADDRCSIRPEEGLNIARVWDEARKALEAASFTDRSDSYRYATETYERDMDREARVVERETSTTREGFMRVPYSSLPAEELLENGFVQPAGPGGRSTYYAPDAQVLLSDAFLDTHCLRLRSGEGEAEGLLGVGFEPSSDRSRRLPDIAGTLWLDPETAELEWLEYRYVNVLPGIATDLVGGRVDFQRMPDGTWIVPTWWIRMPRLVRENAPSGGTRTRIDGYRQVGGRVLEVRSSRGEAFLRGETGTVEGSVQDSLGVLPVAGVQVGVVGSNQTVFTDAEGRFRITGLTGGTYRIGFTHDRWEALGLEADPITREVTPGEVTNVLYRMPALSELIYAACRPGEAEDAPMEGTAMLAGRVMEPGGRRPVPELPVQVRWEEFRMSGGGPRGRELTGAAVHGFETLTDERGFYRVCGVPEERLLRVSVRVEDREIPVDSLRIPAYAGGQSLDLEWSPR